MASDAPRGSSDWLRMGRRRPDSAPQTPSAQAPPSTPTGGWKDHINIWGRNKSEKLPDLCEQCSKINFDQFASSNPLATPTSEDVTRTTISLFDIIKNNRENKCKFCTLLFDAIALPRHDPFESPAVKDHMPNEFRGKTFETWAKGIRWHDKILKIPHPFGQGRNKIKLEQHPTNPDMLWESRDQATEDAKQIGVVASAGAFGATTQAASQTQNRDEKQVLEAVGSAGTLITSVVATMDYKLPVHVVVKLHNTNHEDAGLLEIRLWGYGSKVQASLSVLTKFNLRVASNDMVKSDGLSLRYGKTIGENVDVEGNCLTWLSHCCDNHEECGRPDWSIGLPEPSGEHFRLIKIEGAARNGRGENEQYTCKLVQVDIERRGGTMPEYAALSYVWGDTGGTKALNLHPQNLSQLSDGIEISEIARTISDAIKVAGRLGIRYLWADSLCVIQKNRAGDDEPWARETQLQQMDSIYCHAAVVITAAAGESAEAGLTGISSPRECQQMAQEVRPNVNVLLPVDYDKSYGLWDTRGWTLQEKLLSRRMLVFGGSYVSFHCRHGILREDMPAKHAGNGPPPIPCLSMPSNRAAPMVTKRWNDTTVLLRSPFFTEYAKLLQQYTSRDMTQSNDILSGMLGLLKVLENMRNLDGPSVASGGARDHGTQLGDHTLQGLPEEFLDLALLWQPPAVEGTYLTKRANSRFPSWSWAGWEVSRTPSHEGDDDATIAKEHHARPGVRFEEPFWVSGNDDMSLRKFVATDQNAEERFKPMVLWYKWVARRRPPPPPPPPKPKPKPQDLQTRRQNMHGISSPMSTTSCQRSKSPQPPTGHLVPVNGHGLGILFDSKSKDTEERAFKSARKFLELVENEGAPPVPHWIRLDRQNLVCTTQVARFRLRKKLKDARKEVLWKKVEKVTEVEKVTLVDNAISVEKVTSVEHVAEVEQELQIHEAEILDESDNVVGHVIPTDQHKSISTDMYDFILLSESQYWGNEKRIDVTGFPLFNVMLVEWESVGGFAVRTGLGKVFRPAWNKATVGKQVVILK